ncbi:MAG: hypothetical protein KF891_15545 [Rhizobacter sp.]|nr:hypothetical protein [Rhizobacter sp.]
MTFGNDNFEYPAEQPLTYVLLDPKRKTINKTVMARQGSLRRQQGHEAAFAPERHGNKVETFITGEDYFRDVCASIQGARHSVFITGWQVNWAVKLTGNTRLIDALKAAVQNGAKVYVMPWQSPKVGVNTGDLATMLAVFQLNCGRRELQAFCCPAGLQNDHAGIEETFFSHHQKLVLVDAKIAYVGGIDLAFGRRDDARFSLAHEWRTGPEVYNTGVPPRHKLLPAESMSYVDETELLKATLAVGPLKRVVNFQSDATETAAKSRLGQTVDAGVDWWRRPLDLNNVPRFLRQPVAWTLSAKQEVGEVMDAATASARRAFDEAQQKSADALIRNLDGGLISTSQLTAAIDAARAAVRTTYNALLGISWANETVYEELGNSTSQSMPPGEATYDPDQPRMPWQDVQVRIEGPSVYDLSQNFVRRWNSVQKSYLLGPLERRTHIGQELCPPEPGNGKGNGGTGGVAVRVLRSAPLKMQRDEALASPGSPPPHARQHEIHDAMVAAIRNAERFIYIENQFFQSAFGEPSLQENMPDQRSGPVNFLTSVAGTRIKSALTRASADNTNTAPRNHVSRAIADRIERAIQWGHPFHAYIVLPVHPEGSLADLAIVGQVHWTMQSLVYASDSLINRVRLALYAKQICKQPRSQSEWDEAKRRGLQVEAQRNIPEYARRISVDDVSDHLTLLNLRGCESLGGVVRTEQIYVHSKLLIVDDRVVIVGSANINDRSLSGGRDSELAVLLMDLSTKTAPINGKNAIHVRTLAHELRVNLWKKHFALLGHTNIVRPATSLASMIDRPSDPETWRAIQRVATANAGTYATSFAWVPRDHASIWPVWTGRKEFASTSDGRARAHDALSGVANLMPFSEGFWERGPDSALLPAAINGFICALPTAWTQGENNHTDMNMVLLTQVDGSGDGNSRRQALLTDDAPVGRTS